MSTLPSTIRESMPLPGNAGGSGTGGSGPQQVLTPADIWLMLRRRTVLIVVLSVLFAMISTGGFLVWWTYFPGYRAECLIECVSNIPDAELAVDQERLKREEQERFVLSQAVLLKTPTILGEALKVNVVHETDWYKSVRNQRYLLNLQEELTAAPRRGTDLLSVSMSTRNQRDAAIIINVVVARWYDSVKRRSAQDFAAGSLDAAQEELAGLVRQIEDKNTELRRLASRLPAGARQNPASNIVAQQVGQYGEQVAVLQLELALLEQFRAMYNDPSGVAVTAEDRSMVEADFEVADLAQRASAFEQQLAADSEQFGSKHRERRRLEAMLKVTTQRLAEVRQVKLRERRDDIREQANTAYANTQHAVFLSQENLAKAEAALQDQDQLLLTYVSLEDEIDLEMEYKLHLDNYIKSLTRVVRQQTAVNVNIAQHATDPLERSSPTMALLPVGFVMSLMLAVGMALGLELLDKSVRTSQDIVRHLDIAMLGAVPDIDDEEVSIKQVETAVKDAPQSMIAEAFRHIRTSLQFSAPAERQKTVVVTSPSAENGKTTVATNLALAGAQAGKRILLIDANFRRPRIHSLFPGVGPAGLTNILIGEGTLESCVVTAGSMSLDLLGCGPLAPNPAELLGGKAFSALLEQASATYDQVIIDSAPLLLASDAIALAPAVDGVILVVRAQTNSRGAARRACRLLADVNGHLFGAVLNAAQVTRGGYFREQLRAYYDYQEQSSTDASLASKSKTTT